MFVCSSFLFLFYKIYKIPLGIGIRFSGLEFISSLISDARKIIERVHVARNKFRDCGRREIDVIFQCENVKEKSIVSLLGDTF